MKTIVLLLALLVLAATAQPRCLLEEPLTDECLNSIQPNSLPEKKILSYLCVIASERQLEKKAEEFCRAAYLLEDVQSGYSYFKVLLKEGKYQAALKIEYSLFFVNPFSHNNKLSGLLQALKPTLSAVEIDPTKDTNLFPNSIFYFYSNQTEKSLSELRKHLQTNKGEGQMFYQHFLMARVLEKEQQYYDALQYLSELLKGGKAGHPYLHHLKGNFLMHHVQFQKAIAEFEQANKEFVSLYMSEFGFSNYNIALCYEKLGKVEEALKYYEKSVLNLESAEALNALGHAHFTLYEGSGEKRQLGLAEKYYKRALEVNEQYTVTVFNLGILKLKTNHTLQAIQYFQQCLSMQQSFRSCQLGLVKAHYSLNDSATANQIIEGIEKTEDTIAELLAVLYEIGDHQRALELTGKKEDFKSLELVEWKGFNQYAIGQYERAEKSFNRAVFLGAKKAYLYYSLGLAQLEQLKYEECSRSFSTAFRMEAREETKEKMQECKRKSSQDL